MVLFDEVDDRLGQIVLAGQIGSVLDVGNDDQRAHGRHERIVPVRAGPLVLDEIVRLEHLADVVKVSSHAYQQATGPDAFGRRFGNGGHVDRVVVRSRGAANELLQQRVRNVAPFEQADFREHAEEILDHRQQAGDQEAGRQGPQRVANRLARAAASRAAARSTGRRRRS